MAQPFRAPFGEEVRISSHALAEAVREGRFEIADYIFERLPRTPRSISRLRRRLPLQAAGRVNVVWRPSLGDRFATLMAGEGIKGPWRIDLDGKAVVVAFDHFVAVSPAASADDVALLRSAKLID